jgi:hypothetical protein
MDYQSQARAYQLVRRVDTKVEGLRGYTTPKDGVIEDKYSRSGLGPGFYTETHKGFYRLEMDATGRPMSYVDRHEHTAYGYKDETVKMETGADGRKTYSSKLYVDNGGQIISHKQSVQVGPEGFENYQLKNDPKVALPNWIRRNRSTETLLGLVGGGAVGALAGNAVLGLPGALIGGVLAANAVDGVIRQDQRLNHRSDPSNFDRAISRPVDALRTGVQVAGAVTGVGLIFAFSAAVTGIL